MEGLFLCCAGKAQADEGDADVRLLAQHENVEIMLQRLIKGATFWLDPADDLETLEYFFVHAGEIALRLEDQTEVLRAGDSFYVLGLKEQVLCSAKEETQLLYVSNRPVFTDVMEFQQDLMDMLRLINEKDHYTYRHSLNVMRLSKALYLELGAQETGISMEEIIMASLFHDVGKCHVPDEVLKKPGRLTPEEYETIKRHPLESAALLEGRFGAPVAEVAKKHHERLDGSGYPQRLTAGEISFPARIVAVADCFDAMTTDRGYNRVKTYADAAEELYGLETQFDRRATDALRRLVSSGAIERALN
jgi:putative nucleotidyltransferase with HDIG domain